MKKVFLVYGQKGQQKTDALAGFPILLEERNKGSLFFEVEATGTCHEALDKTLNAIRDNGKDYVNMIVVYSGENTYLLEDNLPCGKVNFDLLKEKLCEVIGGNNTLLKNELMSRMLIGAITEITSDYF